MHCTSLKFLAIIVFWTKIKNKKLDMLGVASVPHQDLNRSAPSEMLKSLEVEEQFYL